MVKKRITKRKNKISALENLIPTIPRINISTIKNVGAIGLEISKSSATLGEMASALSVGMPSKEIFNGYKSVLDMQNTILKSVDIIQKNFAPGMAQINEVVNKVGSAFHPITGAIVDLGLNIANANKLFEDSVIKRSNFLDLQKLSSISFDTIKEQQNSLISSLKKANNFENLITNPSISSIPMVATGLDIITRAMPTFPSSVDLPSLEAVRENYFLDESEINREHDKLDGILKRIDPELVNTRRGCWGTFNARRPDYIRQASSSMRGLVDDLLRNIAPRKFSTRKDRIYYAVDYESKKAVHLERMTKAFLETYDNLSAWDHKPTKNDEFVRGVFITIEGCLISLLSEIRKEG